MTKSIACLLAVLCLAQAAFGQGHFFFDKELLGKGDGFLIRDGRFLLPGDALSSSIGSPDWMVRLLGGPAGTPVTSLVPLDPPSTGFQGPPGSNGAGYVVGVTTTVPGVPPGALAAVLIRVSGPGGAGADFGPVTVTLVPEPSTWMLALLGVAAALAWRKHPTPHA
jgi:hypothetical protein